MKNKEFFLALFIFVLGYFLGYTDPRRATEKNDQVVNQSKWQQLKIIDDEGFASAGTSMYICSSIMRSIGNGDEKALDFHTDQAAKMVKKVSTLSEKRIKILKELGY